METNNMGMVLVSDKALAVLSKIPPQNLIDVSSLIEGSSRVTRDSVFIVVKIATVKVNQLIAFCELVDVPIWAIPTEFDDNSPGWRVATSRLQRLSLEQYNSIIGPVSNDTNIGDEVPLTTEDVSEESIGVIE